MQLELVQETSLSLQSVTTAPCQQRWSTKEGDYIKVTSCPKTLADISCLSHSAKNLCQVNNSNGFTSSKQIPIKRIPFSCPNKGTVTTSSKRYMKMLNALSCTLKKYFNKNQIKKERWRIKKGCFVVQL